MENRSSSPLPVGPGNNIDDRASGQDSWEIDSFKDSGQEEESRLSSTFATAEVPADVVLDASGYENNYTRRSVITSSGDGNYGFSSSSSSSSQPSGGDILREDLDDDEMARLDSKTSSRSSISSIPASVVVHPTDASKTSGASELQWHTDSCYHAGDYHVSKKKDEYTRPAANIRGRDIPFRKPSSVRAMQMHSEDEDEDEEYFTPSRYRGPMHTPRNSETLIGSPPLKRSPYYSPNGSPHKQKIKKEYPLVLLHCNVLPPTLLLPPGVGVPSPRILKEVLPPRYWRRWKLLEEKIGSSLLRDRGVLISHPQEMYDLLEERLLESLELLQPRLRHGHFLGRGGHDSGSDDDDDGCQESDTDGAEGEECPDCGARVVEHDNGGRKWEIKVYAANGLMRAGAWAAAWREMEKVDVEVGLWLPSSVRRELERRTLEEETVGYDQALRASEEEKRRGVYGEQPPPPPSPHPPSQEQIDGLDDAPRLKPPGNSATPNHPAPGRQEHRISVPPSYVRRTADEIELQTLLINYIRVLASDRRNVAIACLSVLVVFLAIGGGGGGRDARPGSSQVGPFHPGVVEFVPTSAVSVAQYHLSATNPPAVPVSENPAVAPGKSVETHHFFVH